MGVVDVGSNSVRLVVFDGAARSPAYFYNEKIMCALGDELVSTGKLSVEGRVRALAAIRRFQLIADSMGISPLTAVATAAMREASDGPAFREEIEAETGLKVYVIDGPEEARLSAQGVLLGWPEASGLVCDIGGSSMELAEVSKGTVGRCVSSQLGPLRLRALDGGEDAIRAAIKTQIKELRDTMGTRHQRLFLVGGSWRAIAKIDMLRKAYPMSVLHEYRMNRKSVFRTLKYIRKTDVEELRQLAGLSSARAALLPIAAEVLSELIETFRPKDIAVSSYGIREGMLYEQMPPELRERDPLIEACRFAEAKDARLPGFGRRLYEFIEPIFEDESDARKRVIRAACLLHDVSWRAHPDYRHEICFDYATRANLGGLTHPERIYLGIALLHRYKNTRANSRFHTLATLIPEEDVNNAEVVGKAMRFGAMLSVSTTELMGRLEWSSNDRTLNVHLASGSEALFGEVTEARFNALSDALNATPNVIRP